MMPAHRGRVSARVGHRDPAVAHEADGVQLRAEDEHECASQPLLVVGTAIEICVGRATFRGSFP
jgi:hypothetical protein